MASSLRKRPTNVDDVIDLIERDHSDWESAAKVAKAVMAIYQSLKKNGTLSDILSRRSKYCITYV